MWSTRCRGFLPSRDPLVKLTNPVYAVLHELCELMPATLADGSFRSLVEQHIERFGPITAAIEAEEGEGSEERLERVHALYGYIGKGFVLGSGAVDARAALVVPEFLAAGWLAVANRLGRHPTLDYADCVLNNWERIDPLGGITPENVRLLHRFTGLLDEEWFLKTHVIIESEAAGAISAIYDGYQAVKSRDIEALLRSLSWMEQVR
jgi:indoleamine 2,3-dioxygenase